MHNIPQMTGQERRILLRALAVSEIADRAIRLLLAGKTAEAVRLARRGYAEAHEEYMASADHNERVTWNNQRMRAQQRKHINV